MKRYVSHLIGCKDSVIENMYVNYLFVGLEDEEEETSITLKNSYVGNFVVEIMDRDVRARDIREYIEISPPLQQVYTSIDSSTPIEGYLLVPGEEDFSKGITLFGREYVCEKFTKHKCQTYYFSYQDICVRRKNEKV